MTAAAEAGEQARALAAYEALRQRLGSELGADPAPQTRELHLAILRERDGGLARSGPSRAAPGGPKPGTIMLAGRDRESTVLREAWAAAAGGQPRLVTITGEAGIGKTALAEALAAEAAGDGGTVLRTRCYETERSLFLQPIVEAIAPVVASTPAGTLRRLLGEHAAADWTAAAVAMKSAIEINGTAGYPHTTAWYVAHQGWLARLCGRMEAAIRLGHQAVELTEQHEVTWWQATACAMLGDTVLLAGDRAGAIALFERGLAAARQAGVEGYLLRCAAPLAAATGSRALLAEAAGLLEQASIPDGSAWVPGYEAYLSLAEGWLSHDEPDRARAVLAPLLAVAERKPWIPVLAAALAVDGRALVRLGRPGQARAELVRAARLAGEHGLPHVLRGAREAVQGLG